MKTKKECRHSVLLIRFKKRYDTIFLTFKYWVFLIFSGGNDLCELGGGDFIYLFFE